MSVASTFAVRLVRAVLRSPFLKSLARRILAHFPSLQGRLRSAIFRATLAPHAKWSTRPRDEGDLSPRTVRMLDALRRAQRQREL